MENNADFENNDDDAETWLLLADQLHCEANHIGDFMAENEQFAAAENENA